MKVLLSHSEQISAQKAQADVEPLIKHFIHSNALNQINVHVESGVILVQGYDTQGNEAKTALGFSTLREIPSDTLAAYTIQRLRKKLGLPSFPSRRKHVGQFQIPIL